MKIQVLFSRKFSHPNVVKQTFDLDVDANQSIYNLKTLITLRYIDLDPSKFDLISYQNGTKYSDESFCKDLQIPNSEFINQCPCVVMANYRGNEGCCTVF